MGQTSWITNAEGEQEYVDKGAITMPTPNTMAQAKLMMAEADADRIDYVKWPTMVHGQENQGI
jgi:hypothetical protein